MDETLWNGYVEFHGHSCPGLAIGYAAVLAAVGSMGVPLRRARDEGWYACPRMTDAAWIAYSTCPHASWGRGIYCSVLSVRARVPSSRGNREGGTPRRRTASRREGLGKKALIKNILESPPEGLFLFKEPDFGLPERRDVRERTLRHLRGGGERGQDPAAGGQKGLHSMLQGPQPVLPAMPRSRRIPGQRTRHQYIQAVLYLKE